MNVAVTVANCFDGGSESQRTGVSESAETERREAAAEAEDAEREGTRRAAPATWPTVSFRRPPRHAETDGDEYPPWASTAAVGDRTPRAAGAAGWPRWWRRHRAGNTGALGGSGGSGRSRGRRGRVGASQAAAGRPGSGGGATPSTRETPSTPYAAVAAGAPLACRWTPSARVLGRRGGSFGGPPDAVEPSLGRRGGTGEAAAGADA